MENDITIWGSEKLTSGGKPMYFLEIRDFDRGRMISWYEFDFSKEKHLVRTFGDTAEIYALHLVDYHPKYTFEMINNGTLYEHIMNHVREVDLKSEERFRELAENNSEYLFAVLEGNKELIYQQEYIMRMTAESDVRRECLYLFPFEEDQDEESYEDDEQLKEYNEFLELMTECMKFSSSL